MRLQVHLNFSGNCKQAFQFYEKALNAKNMFQMTYGESPMAGQTPSDWKDKIMHTSLALGDHVLMGADSWGEHYKAPQGFAVCVDTADPAEADRVFNALSDGAKVTMPIQETFWAKRFGMLTDKFGTPWMVNCGKNPSGQ